MLKPDHYTYRVTWSSEDEEYVGLCIEFASLSWLAPTHEEALTGIRQLISDCVADMKANNDHPPEPMPTAHTADGSWFAYHRKFIVLSRLRLQKKVSV